MPAPKLRFKEFDGDWQQIKISDYSDTVTSGSRDWAQYYSDKGDKFIRMTNLVRDGIYLDLSDLRFVDLPKDSNEGKRTSLQSGDILISITAELGKLGWVQDDLGTAYINQHTALVRMSEKVDSKFIAYTLSTEKYNNKLNNLNDSGAKAGLNLGTIRSFELTTPQKIEQTKIASFLSAVDEKISQLTQKHELLSQYKQGMMQKLFSQQIRFKADDGSKFGEWESISIKNAASFIKDGTHGTHQDDPTSHLFLLSAKNLQNGHVVIDEKDRRINKLEFDSIYKNYGLNTGDILLSVVGTIGRVAIFKEEYKNYAFQRSVAFMRFKSAKPEFIFQLFNAVDFQNELLVRQVVSAQPGIYLGDLSKIEIKLPCLEEQTKIANFLSAIDQKIDVVAQQIEQAKQWKKGLLQQMFV